jgi:shikimate kinase
LLGLFPDDARRLNVVSKPGRGSVPRPGFRFKGRDGRPPEMPQAVALPGEQQVRLVSVDPHSRPILLVGMMGSGKSTIGRALAERTGWPFIDNDALVERRTGRTARDLLDGGLDALRWAESRALRDGLAEAPPVIVGVAAGVVMDPKDRRAMRDGIVVWLRARPETLARRVLAALGDEEGSHRPWLAGGPDAALAWLRETSRDRRALFESIATITVDVDTGESEDRPVEEVVDEIAVQLLAPASIDGP